MRLVKYQTRTELTANEKHFSLLQHEGNYKSKMLYTTAPGYDTLKYQTRMELTANEKHCSLLQREANYSCKKFHTPGPW